ncbi:hypothetical protein AL047_09240 [Pseudomonas syringae pv. broussonetiae]|nr:hypothetical protein AL047_09240 [Pseudomonas syringae pv. broussonetiae]
MGSYYVIFEIREAVQPGRQKQDLTIVVENAYHYDPEQANPVLLAEMGFLTLCANAYMRKPVAVKRLEEKRKKAPREALIYSIFRPFNALEALIYQGATAGF